MRPRETVLSWQSSGPRGGRALRPVARAGLQAGAERWSGEGQAVGGGQIFQ